MSKFYTYIQQEGRKFLKCENCKGKGFLFRIFNDPNSLDQHYTKEPCKDCSGKGEVIIN